MTLQDALAAAFTDEHVARLDIQQHEWEMESFLNLVEQELKPKRTVELGTYKGWTSAILSHVSDQTVTIDIENHGTEESRPYSKDLTCLLGSGTEPSLPETVTRLMGGPIDLLFIDDGHYYETIVREYALWSPHVREGGWIVFHDINPLGNIGPGGVQPDCIQVTRFWNELKGDKVEIIANESHREWKGPIPHGGLGILRVPEVSI